MEKGQDLHFEILTKDLPEYDLTFKLIIVGDLGVGKSCLAKRATKNYLRVTSVDREPFQKSFWEFERESYCGSIVVNESKGL